MRNLLYDELGRTITLNKQKERISGIECLNNNIEIVRNIASLLSTSFGPNGLDKILVSGDDDIVISNDGFTILDKMVMHQNPISRLIVELSRAQDEEIGDGTTGIVLLANALLQECKVLLDSGVHPVKISEGLEECVRLANAHLDEISEEIKTEDLRIVMERAAKTSLSSKIVSKCSGVFSKICTDAILEVCDKERRDVDFELIKIEKKIGKDVSETELIRGVLINKEFSHPQMRKKIEDAKIAVLTCPFEPPKIKTQHSVNISNVEEFKKLEEYEKTKFTEMIDSIKKSGANVVACQWGFDDEANYLLMENDLPAIRWVGGQEMELLAVHCNASIISRFEDLRPEDLGSCSIEEMALGTEDKKFILLKKTGEKSKTVTILIRGGTEMAMEEAERSVIDALSAVRNILVADKIIYGGGSAEISTSRFLQQKSIKNPLRNIMLAFSRALEEIPLILAKNSGLDGPSLITALRLKQEKQNKSYLGIDCNEVGEIDMKKLNVFDSLDSKKQQLLMATQLVTTILKIDDVISIAKKN